MKKITKKDEKEVLERFLSAMHGRSWCTSLKVMKRLSTILEDYNKDHIGLCDIKKIYLLEMKDD